MYMLGTAASTDTRAASIRLSAWSGVKRGSKATVAQAAKAAFIDTVWPKAWNRGRPPKMTSSAVKPKTFTQLRAFEKIFAWLRVAPFGRPVVPEVYRITAGSCSFTTAGASGTSTPSKGARGEAEGSKISHRTEPFFTGTVEAASCARRVPAKAKRTFAPLSSRWYSSSAPDSRGLSGTQIAPRAAIP